MNIVQASIKPRRYIGQRPGRHAWSIQHGLQGAPNNNVNVRMTALSDETYGGCADDHVGEAHTSRQDLAGQWPKAAGALMASSDRPTVLRPVDKLRAALTLPLAIHAVGIDVLIGNL